MNDILIKPVCEMCNDTHRIELKERMVLCTYCPLPCMECIKGSYCTITPCNCHCHKKDKKIIKKNIMGHNEYIIMANYCGKRITIDIYGQDFDRLILSDCDSTIQIIQEDDFLRVPKHQLSGFTMTTEFVGD